MADRWAEGSGGGAYPTMTASATPVPAAEQRSTHRRWRLTGLFTGTTPPPLIIRGMLAGVAAALTFRHAALLLLSVPGLTSPPSFSLKPAPGMTFPALAGVVVWAGLWGAALALMLARRRGPRAYWTTTLLLGGVLPTAAGVLMLLVDKGPAAFAWVDLLVGLIVNSAWAIGAAVFLLIL